ERPDRPVVLCSVGDGTTQEGEFLEALAEAVRRCLPVLFLIQDNRWAISTATSRQTFWSLPGGDAETFYGLSINRVDGRDPVTSFHTLGARIEEIRQHRKPVLVVINVERLDDHTNSDDQNQYREAQEIAASRELGDPIRRLEAQLPSLGVNTSETNKVREEV